MRSVAKQPVEEPRSRLGTPVWEIARLYPTQGHWSEEDYLAIDTRQFVELNRGMLEFPPYPTILHQLIVGKLMIELLNHVRDNGLGHVLFNTPVKLATRLIRVPDIVCYRKHQIPKDLNKPLKGAELVVEVVSPGEESRQRDLIEKRRDYAKAGIAEYWLVDPESSTITVLTLNGKKYEQAGKYNAGQTAVSRLLPGFEVNVTDALTADQPALHCPTKH